MTRTATGDIANADLPIRRHQFSRAHFVFRNQERTQQFLVYKLLIIHRNRTTARRRLIPHIENLIARPEIFPGIAMTAEAPLHLQRFLLIHQRHLVDRAVASVAADSLGDMNTVIEVDEVGKLVDPRPLQRFSAAIAGSHRLEQLRVGPDLRVAVHAGLGRWNSGKARRLTRGVTVTAVNAKPRNVMLMTEGYWLRLAYAGVGCVGRVLNLHRHPGQRSEHEDSAKNSGARQSVRAAMKNLRHGLCDRAGDPADLPQIL
jgi:hypothetical protein